MSAHPALWPVGRQASADSAAHPTGAGAVAPTWPDGRALPEAAHRRGSPGCPVAATPCPGLAARRSSVGRGRAGTGGTPISRPVDPGAEVEALCASAALVRAGGTIDGSARRPASVARRFASARSGSRPGADGEERSVGHCPRRGAYGARSPGSRRKKRGPVPTPPGRPDGRFVSGGGPGPRVPDRVRPRVAHVAGRPSVAPGLSGGGPVRRRCRPRLPSCRQSPTEAPGDVSPRRAPPRPDAPRAGACGLPWASPGGTASSRRWRRPARSPSCPPGRGSLTPSGRAPCKQPQRASAARTCSGVGAVPPRWAGIHQVSVASLGRTG